MPQGVVKVGETHAQSPQQRANQFRGVDRKVTWTVQRALQTPDSRHTEKLVHRRLKSMGCQYMANSELFEVSVATALAIIEECVALTPVPALREVAVSTDVAVPREPGPWGLALTMPVSCKEEPRMTLARAMALVAQGNHLLRTRLARWGLELVYPDDKAPGFRIHALPGSDLGRWLQTQGIGWDALGIETGSSRKVRFELQPGH
jgi:hypothetical protein